MNTKRLQNAPRIAVRAFKALVDQYETQEVEDWLDERVRELGLVEVKMSPADVMAMMDQGVTSPAEVMAKMDRNGFYR